MRRFVTTLLFVALPALASAQSTRSSTADAPTLPTIGLPLPQIGLPLPSIGLAPAPDTRSRPNARPSAPGRRGGTKSSRGRATVVYIGPGYGWGYGPGVSAAAAPASREEPAADQQPKPQTGALQLDLLPAGIVQLFVDGYYVGTSSDVNDQLALEAGPHKIEMRAPGYESASVDVRIDPGRTINYRGALVRQDAKPAPEPAARPADVKPIPRKPVYIIPGCYLGNVPPKDAGLPASCDQSRVKVLEP